MIVKNCTLIRALSCKKDTNIVEVAKTLRENRQRRIIVTNDNQEPVGIISTTDINNKVVAESKDTKELKAADIMTSPIYLVADIEDNLNNIFQKMMEHNSFFVPVIKEKKLYGILTYGELYERVKNLVKNEH